MTRQRFYNLLAAAVAALIAIVLILAFLFGQADNIPAAKESEGICDADGTPIAAVSILDLKESNVLLRANYTPDEFLKVSPAESNGKVPFGTPVTLSETKFAEKGTLRFVILNIDPWATDFSQQQKALAPYLGADNYWHFSLVLPPVFSACTVYVRAVLVGSAGLISDYNFIDYSEYNFDSVAHKDGSEPLTVDLQFYTRREAILSDRLKAAVTVTVHYEGAAGKTAGLAGKTLIGAPDTVENLLARDKSALTSLLIVSALALAVFVFLCFLKRSISFLPQPLMTLGVFGVLLSAFFLASKTAAPYTWQAVGLFAFSFIVLAALFALRVKWRQKPVWAIPAAFAFINCVVAFAAPFIPAAYAAAAAYLAVADTISAGFVLLFAAVKTRDAATPLQLINPVLAGVTAVAGSFYPATATAFANPLLWLFALIIAATIAVSFREFVGAEKRNRYLTANLSEEVARRTQGLQDVIAERDKILMYVGHDMKKPVVFMDGALGDLLHSLGDERLAAKVEAIRAKNAELKKDFAELSKFSKLNYSPEMSEVFNAADLVRAAANELRPDCEANGILLTVTAPASLRVYAKQNGLLSVILNLMLNAIEHSRCARLSVSVARKKGVCRIDVADDGNGIRTDADIFEPYVSGEQGEENSGLGLYLARENIRSMGGDLTYAQAQGKLTFTVTLPLA